MSQIGMIAKLTAQEGKRDELVKELNALVEAVQTEPGTLAYVLHTVNDDPNVVVFYEFYQDDQALAVHSSSDAMKAVGPKLAGLLAGRPELTRMTPVGGKGVKVG